MKVCPNEACPKTNLGKNDEKCPECGSEPVILKAGSKEIRVLLDAKKGKEPQESSKVGEGPWAEVLRKNITYPEFHRGHLLAYNCPNTMKCMAITMSVPAVSAHQTCAICMMLQQLIVLNKEKAASPS